MDKELVVVSNLQSRSELIDHFSQKVSKITMSFASMVQSTVIVI